MAIFDLLEQIAKVKAIDYLGSKALGMKKDMRVSI